jgi:hypothetical protein
MDKCFTLSHIPTPILRNLATTPSCLNTEDISTERVEVIKTSNQQQELTRANPNTETQEV